MTEDGVCDECSWRVTTAFYVDRQGRASRLCGRCLDRAVERRDMEVKLESMFFRLGAQQSQYRQLESGYENLREENDRLKAEVYRLRFCPPSSGA